MTDPKELKKAIIAALVEKKDYTAVLDHLDTDGQSLFGEDATQMRDLIMSALAEKGEYKTILSHITKGEKQTKEQKALTEVVKPFADIAQLIIGNTKGDFMSDLVADMDGKLSKKGEELLSTLTDSISAFQLETKAVIDDATTESIARLAKTEADLKASLLELATTVVASKANELLPTVSQQAKLTKAEIDEIIYQTALSVESQVSTILGDYVAEQGISSSQILDFKEAVQAVVPQVDFSTVEVDWSQIKNAPEPSQGGTSAILVKRMIEEALAGFSGGSGVPDGGLTGQVLTKASATDGDATWQTSPTGVTDHGLLSGLADDDHTQYHTDARGDARYFTQAQVTTALAGKANTSHSHVIADTTGLQTALDAKANTSSLAPVATSGAYADLTGLPDLSVFDEVEQYANLAAFPGTGNVAKFYLAQDTGLLYRWTGSAYAVISAELALGETSTTAYRGDRGKIAFDHTSLTNNPHSVTKSQVGLGNADNTSDLAKPISTATQTALDGKANTSHTHTASQVTDFNEAAQDAVGTILTDTTSIDLIYDDASNTISAQREALTGDVTAPKNSNATTLATVNSNVGSFGLAGSVAQFTVNAKGLITAAANVAISITASAVTDFAATVRATVLTGLSVATSTAVTATDSILVAIGKLQAQNTAQDTAIAGKANTAHTHVIADTTGLQTALDGKAATSHTHTKSQVTDFQHSITGTEHTFPGGTTNFLRADGTFAAPPSGFADPLTTNGDIIARIAGATTRLPQGANGTFLGVSGGALGYYTPPGGGSGITEAQARTISRRYAVALG